jgi:hypothetical protein
MASISVLRSRGRRRRGEGEEREIMRKRNGEEGVLHLSFFNIFY